MEPAGQGGSLRPLHRHDHRAGDGRISFPLRQREWLSRLGRTTSSCVDEIGVGDAPSILSGTIALEKGKADPIRVEGVQKGARGEQHLVWSTPSQNGDDAAWRRPSRPMWSCSSAAFPRGSRARR